MSPVDNNHFIKNHVQKIEIKTLNSYPYKYQLSLKHEMVPFHILKKQKSCAHFFHVKEEQNSHIFLTAQNSCSNFVTHSNIWIYFATLSDHGLFLWSLKIEF